MTVGYDQGRECNDGVAVEAGAGLNPLYCSQVAHLWYPNTYYN